MQNLEQIRAQHALAIARNVTRQDASKLPAMIITNGLLATAAFASEQKSNHTPKRVAMNSIMDSVATHLTERGIIGNARNAIAMIEQLNQRSSETLQQATTEALALITYVKSFANPDAD